MRQHVLHDPIVLTIRPLTQSHFAPYGTVVENPARAGSSLLSTAVPANQGTATKYPSITPLINQYEFAPTHQNAEAKMAMFVCKPRALAPLNGSESGMRSLGVKILERHPYTTQTFLPLGLSLENEETAFIVVVAPTMDANSGSFDGPDVGRAEAFIANGTQGVTYGAGTWHAPMVVVGKKEVEFVVVQYVNGVSEDDCEEVELVEWEGNGGKVEVKVPMVGSRKGSKL